MTTRTIRELQMQLEIDSLKAGLADAKLLAFDNANWFDALKADYDKLKAEIEELRQDNKEWLEHSIDFRKKYDKLKAENENLHAYAIHERGLGAEPFIQENLSLTQQLDALKAELERAQQKTTRFASLPMRYKRMKSNAQLIGEKDTP